MGYFIRNTSNIFYISLVKFVLCVLLCRHIDGYINIYNIGMFHIIIVRNKWNCLYNMLFVCSAHVFIQYKLCHSNMKNCCQIVHMWWVGNTLTTCKITVYTRYITFGKHLSIVYNTSYVVQIKKLLSIYSHLVLNFCMQQT